MMAKPQSNEAKEGQWVSLDGNITADDSMGLLPNGWSFEEEDVYQVIYDQEFGFWTLDLGCKPDTAYNRKYMSHATSLLHDGRVLICEAPTRTTQGE